MKPDTQEHYGTVSRILHWGMAVLIAWQLLKFFDRIADGEHWVGQNLVSWHVSIGSLLMLIIVLRVLWAVKQKGQRPPADPKMAFLVQAGHWLLYAGMVLMPLTGIMIMLGNGYGLDPFGIELVAGGTEIGWMATLGSLHSPIAWLFLLLIAGHAGMALLHHFVMKDDTMRRML